MFDFFKDILSAFHKTSSERLKSPFLGAFVFSWLSFNWDSLAIIVFSKKDIEQRIQYVFSNHDVGSFLLAPLSIATVICLTLPEINKIFIKIQSKPIHEATTTAMLAKIALAEQQLQISEIEAKKRLAEKKEEKEIDQGIQNIRTENINLTFNIESLEKELSTTIDYLNEERIAKSTLQNLYDNEQGAMKILLKELDSTKEHNSLLLTQLSQVNSQLSSANERANDEIKNLNEINAKFNTLSGNIHEKDDHIESLQKSIDAHNNQLSNLIRLFPNLFTIFTDNYYPVIYVYKPAVDRLIMLSNEMASIVHNNNHDPSQSSTYQLAELIKIQRNELYNSANMPLIFSN